MTWLLATEQAPLIGFVSLCITIIGFGLTAWALFKTYEQAREAESAAEKARQAVSDVQIKIDSYSALRDVNEALLCMESCKRHLVHEAWPDASETYEAAHRAIVRLTQSDIDFGRALNLDLVRMGTHVKAFCDQVDAAKVGKGEYPDRAKVLIAIRENYKILYSANSVLEKSILK